MQKNQGAYDDFVTSRPGVNFASPGVQIASGWALVALYVAVVILWCLGWPVGYYDEPTTLVQARMVAQGHTPYVDFWSFYPPLTYYLNAAMFFVFGQTFLAQRILHLTFYLLILVFTYRFWELRLRSPLISCFATLLVAACIGPMLLSTTWIGFSLALLALLVYFSSYRTSRTQLWLIVAAGLLAGLSILSRVNFGVYAAAVICIDLVLTRLAPPNEARFELSESPRHLQIIGTFFISLLVCCIGIFWVLCGPRLALAIQQSVIYQQHAMILRFIPLQITPGWLYAVMFPCAWFCIRLVVGSEEIKKKALLPLLCAMGIFVLAWLRRANPAVALDVAVAEIAAVLLLHVFICRLERAELSLVLLFSCLLHYYLARADAPHGAVLLPVAALLIRYVLFSPIRVSQEEVAKAGVKFGSAIALLTLCICIVLCIPGYRPAGLRNGLELILTGGLWQRIPDAQRVLAAAALPEPWRALYPDTGELSAIRFVRERTSGSDSVFVTADDEAEPYVGDVRAYWLLDRPTGSKYYIFDTYLTRQPAVQRAMIEGFQKNNLRWIIFEHDPPTDDAFRQSKHDGSRLLDEFVATNYAQVARFGRYSVLTR
jgi:hypothetical protein